MLNICSFRLIFSFPNALAIFTEHFQTFPEMGSSDKPVTLAGDLSNK